MDGNDSLHTGNIKKTWKGFIATRHSVLNTAVAYIILINSNLKERDVHDC